MEKDKYCCILGTISGHIAAFFEVSSEVKDNLYQVKT